MIENCFTRNGYFQLKSFLNKEDCRAIKKQIDNIILAGHECACSRPHNTLHLLRWNHLIIQNIISESSKIRRLQMATGATDMRWISGYISIKEPFSPPLWWHQDWWCWDHDISYQYETVQIALLIYMDATTNKNGALRVLPGSHHQSDTLHQHLPETEQLGDAIGEEHICMQPHIDQHLLEVEQGDAVAIDYRLLHGTEANVTASRRDCIILNFTPHWQHLPADIREHLAGHIAQPDGNEKALVNAEQMKIMPSFSGKNSFLNVNGLAPSYFNICNFKQDNG